MKDKMDNYKPIYINKNNFFKLNTSIKMYIFQARRKAGPKYMLFI